MRIVHTGNGKSGSWKIRGEQLGDHISHNDFRGADAVVVVKKPPRREVLNSGLPWIWDVVDFYPQPQCTGWVRSKAIHWVKSQLAKYNPDGVIFPNAKMQKDCKNGKPSTVIYHHHRPNIRINPIREDVRVVGYEGSEKYLGLWRKHIERECMRRGWDFVINEGCHADWDICLAFRDPAFNGYAQYSWKSNVKLANAHGSGTPFIGPYEHGYTETQSGYELFTNTPDALSNAFDGLTYERRKRIHDEFIKSAITVDECKMQLRDFVNGCI